MLKTFDELLKTAKEKERRTVAVAVAQDREVLRAVGTAYKYGIIEGILVGDKLEIEAIATEIDLDLTKFQIIHTIAKEEACRKAVELVRNGKADLLMKGFVDTALVLKAVLDKNRGLKIVSLLSHVGVLKVRGFDRLFIQSDSAINIAPTLEQMVKIIMNAVRVAHALGNNLPKVAVVCAVEKVSPKMQASVEAAELTKMNEQGVIGGCIVKGPLALDNAVSAEAARHKGINHPVAGNADVLITSNIEAGNILNKAMEYFGRAEKAGIIMGASAPIILTSRASSEDSKLNSIALGVLLS
ncbi:MAG: phosphate butyryltransferase [Peptococcaceae bacterium]